MSLATADDLRARADRAGERGALAGTPRSRFLLAQRRRLAQRLLPVLAMFAAGTGAVAVADLAREPPLSRWATLSLGLTATALAGLALATAVLRKSTVAMLVLAHLGATVLAVGWGVVAAVTGGAAGPYAIAVPLVVLALVLVLPLPPRLAPAIVVTAAVAVLVACPGAPPSAYILFVLFAGAAYVAARGRRKRELAAFRRTERLASAVARLRRVQDELVMVEKLEALRVLVGGMAHEINNALAVSLASTDRIVELVPEGDVSKAARRAQGGLTRIRTTLERLRRFAMADEATREPADVGAMLDFALESAIGRARSGVIVDRQYDESIGPVECHVGALAEALFQIAKNAIDSMPRGGTVRASTRRDGDRVILSVADEGSGIPEARLAKVFDPYYAREDHDTHAKGRLLPPLPGKSGMGLSTVYGLVSLMGGRVDLASEVGKGTVVSIVLPLRRRGSDHAIASTPPPATR